MVLDCSYEFLWWPEPIFFFVAFREELKRIFLCLYSSSSHHSLMSCSLTDQNFCNTLQKAPIHQSHIHWQIKISWTVFEERLPMNILLRLFQNLTSGFREEDFLRISSCPYSARSLHSQEPCLWTDQNFANNVWKGSPKEHFCEIISKSDQQFQRRDFLRISSCTYSARSLHSPEPCSWTDQNFANNLWKGSPKEHSCEIILKSDQCFQRSRFFKNFSWTDQNFATISVKGHPRNIPVKLFQNLTSGFREEDFLTISSDLYSARSPHSPESCLWMDHNFVNNFWKGSTKEHSCEIFSKSDKQFLRKRFLKNCLKNSISLPRQPEFLIESNSVNNF